MESSGFRSGSFDRLQSSEDEDDDEMVDIAGATLDFSSTDDVPPLGSGNPQIWLSQCSLLHTKT